MNERQIDFLTDLKELLENHNAVLCLETEAVGWEGASAKLTFDINSHAIDQSIGNLIKGDVMGVGYDIKPEFIQKLIDNLKKQV